MGEAHDRQPMDLTVARRRTSSQSASRDACASADRGSVSFAASDGNNVEAVFDDRSVAS
jgi:hypothetical protein